MYEEGVCRECGQGVIVKQITTVECRAVTHCRIEAIHCHIQWCPEQVLQHVRASTGTSDSRWG